MTLVLAFEFPGMRALAASRARVSGRTRHLSTQFSEHMSGCMASLSEVGTARHRRHNCTQPQNGAWHTFARTFRSRHYVMRIISSGQAFQGKRSTSCWSLFSVITHACVYPVILGLQALSRSHCHRSHCHLVGDPALSISLSSW